MEQNQENGPSSTNTSLSTSSNESTPSDAYETSYSSNQCAVCIAEAWWQDQHHKTKGLNFFECLILEENTLTNKSNDRVNGTESSNTETTFTEEYQQQLNSNIQKKGLFFANITMLNLQELLQSFGISNISTDFGKYR